jgi:hypothetical protein
LGFILSINVQKKSQIYETGASSTNTKKLTELHDIPLKYYVSSKKSRKGWIEVNIKNDM